VITLETGRSERIDNMRAFAAAALDLVIEALRGGKPPLLGQDR